GQQAAAGQVVVGQQAAAGQVVVGQQAAAGQVVVGQQVAAGQVVVASIGDNKSFVANKDFINRALSSLSIDMSEYRDGLDLSRHGINKNIFVGVANEKPSSNAIASTLLTGDDAIQGDGMGLSQLRPVAPSAFFSADDSELATAKTAHQALAITQGSQHDSGGDSASQHSNKSPQGGFESLIEGARSEARAAARGAEFSLPTGYKNATTWKPADAMMQIGRAAADGSIRLDLQLEPAHLGKVRVSIQSDMAKQVHLHITVDNAAGRMALDQNMGQLRAALVQQGLDLGGFSMNLSSQGHSHQQQDGRRAPFSSAQGTSFRLQTDEMKEENVATIGVNRAAVGSLSVLA
ncbi:MAG: flagellar hook-length control protein FliK, partial [Mariprofundales bacterium]